MTPDNAGDGPHTLHIVRRVASRPFGDDLIKFNRMVVLRMAVAAQGLRPGRARSGWV